MPTDSSASLTPQVRQRLDEALTSLSEEELHYLSHRIHERLKLLGNIRQAQHVAHFALGDRVFFMHNGQRLLGKIIRLNRKTVTVHTDDHQDWNVMASLVVKIIEQ